MGGINYGRVVIAGLVAGLVANVFDFVINAFIMADDAVAMAQRLNLNQEVMNSTASLVTWVLIDFLYGLVIVFTYAAIRPRFGPGPKTAIIAGLVPYLSVTCVIFGFTMMGLFTQDMFIKGTGLSIITMVATSLTGGALYRE
jgi:hypothetical protein